MVSICNACATHLWDQGGEGGTPSGALVNHTFLGKVSVLQGRQHTLFEKQLGGVTLSDFTVTLN